jgi:methylglutamate dehydrogenase subunit B
MQQFHCPFCGARPETEFVYVRAIESIPQEDPAGLAQELARIYQRTNPRGPSGELWQHASGCRSWLAIRRDTATHAVLEITSLSLQAIAT